MNGYKSIVEVLGKRNFMCSQAGSYWNELKLYFLLFFLLNGLFMYLFMMGLCCGTQDI